MSRKLMITVDVEAQPGRAAGDHVNRLIWGHFPEGKAGIGEMMDVADRHDARLTMFLDWTETDIHGKAIDEAGQEILRRGHDLQLHIHTNFLSPQFWQENGIARETDLNRLSHQQSRAVVKEVVARQAAATGISPVAFRGGGYRYSDSLLGELMRAGVKLDSSVNVSRNTQPRPLPLSRQFLWSNGMIEVPVSCATTYRNITRPFDFNFNSAAFPSAKRLHEYLEAFWSELGEDAIAVLVMHSWSLLKLGETGHFGFNGMGNIERFDAFLAGLPTDVSIVTPADVIESHEKGQLALDPVTVLTGAEPQLQAAAPVQARHVTSPSRPQVIIASAEDGAPSNCPICDAPGSEFVQMNGRRCPGCGSLERQRSFAAAYETEISKHFDMSGKHVLIFSPAASELKFLQKSGIASRTSVDIRPDSKPDIIADVCAMPHIKTASQEFVFASYLMPVVHDLVAAIGEIRRVLKPHGAFISCEPVQVGRPTRETTDAEALSRWYGKEAFEKYKVGSFRTLGDEDYLKALKRFFDVRLFESADPVTKKKDMIYLCHS